MRSQSTHFFLALPVPKEIAMQVRSAVREKNEDLAFKTWVVPDDYHITLHFLGHASQEQLKQVNQGLPDLIKDVKTFELEITRFGTFGEPLSPRILWVGVREEPSLYSLQDEIGTICKQAGFVLERRPYRPHITIARKWEKEDPFSIDLLPIETGIDWKWRVREVLLYQTHMDRLPKYEAIYRYSLP